MADSHPAATAHDRQTSRVNPPSPSSPEAFVLYFAANVNGRCADGHLREYSTMPIDRTSISEADAVGDKVHASIRQLYSIPRSLTGNGVRETLAVLAGDFRSLCKRRRPAPMCSTGSCHGSGTSETRGSRRRTASPRTVPGLVASTCSVTASRSTRSCRGTSFWSNFHRPGAPRPCSVPDVVLGRSAGAFV